MPLVYALATFKEKYTRWQQLNCSQYVVRGILVACLLLSWWNTMTILFAYVTIFHIRTTKRFDRPTVTAVGAWLLSQLMFGVRWDVAIWIGFWVAATPDLLYYQVWKKLETLLVKLKPWYVLYKSTPQHHAISQRFMKDLNDIYLSGKEPLYFSLLEFFFQDKVTNAIDKFESKNLPFTSFELKLWWKYYTLFPQGTGPYGWDFDFDKNSNNDIVMQAFYHAGFFKHVLFGWSPQHHFSNDYEPVLCLLDNSDLVRSICKSNKYRQILDLDKIVNTPYCTFSDENFKGTIFAYFLYNQGVLNENYDFMMDTVKDINQVTQCSSFNFGEQSLLQCFFRHLLAKHSETRHYALLNINYLLQNPKFDLVRFAPLCDWKMYQGVGGRIDIMDPFLCQLFQLLRQQHGAYCQQLLPDLLKIVVEYLK